MTRQFNLDTLRGSRSYQRHQQGHTRLEVTEYRVKELVKGEALLCPGRRMRNEVLLRHVILVVRRGVANSRRKILVQVQLRNLSRRPLNESSSPLSRESLVIRT